MAKTEIQILQDIVKDLNNLSFAGKKSPIFISDTNATAIPNGYCLQFPEETVIAAITYSSDSLSDTLAAETMPAGFIVYLKNITSITLTSGSVFVYSH